MIINAVRKGLICMLPLFLIGAVAELFASIPADWYVEFMDSTFGDDWVNFLAVIRQGTFRMVSVGALIAISYFLAKEKNIKRPGQVNIVVVLLVVVSCFFIMQNVSEGSLSYNDLGQSNLLITIVISVVATSLFYFFSDHKLFKAKLFTDDADILFTQVLYVLEPAVWTTLFFSIIKAVLMHFDITNLNNFIYESLSQSILPQEPNLMSAIFYTLCLSFFWFLGVHGTAVMLNILLRQWIPQMGDNMDMVAAGLTPTNVLNDGFFDVFISLGGSGAILCLIIALLIKARKTNSNKIARFSLPMAFFNISESLVYGLPIVFNPLYLIPFLFVPVVLVLISWACMSIGLVPVPSFRVHWTTPILISGFQST
ncbi:MAG: PTS transporter subunit EIIC, partial [Lachnospiraceae bacterium]|nr:PTS transporter subunit EIIC [Lachnospiraceae bacterium]